MSLLSRICQAISPSGASKTVYPQRRRSAEATLLLRDSSSTTRTFMVRRLRADRNDIPDLACVFLDGSVARKPAHASHVADSLGAPGSRVGVGTGDGVLAIEIGG